jgi:cyclopropane fatty-acyl-phospholipid synthase-like methyltransferase
MINQDKVYLDKEADDFFERNKYNFDNLPTKKKDLVDNFEQYIVSKSISNVLEIGCHIGDLLNYSVEKFEAQNGFGIEPSGNAVEEGNNRFSQKCRFIKGVASQDDVFDNIPACDLVIVNDVFCWISRESILRSVANIDEHIRDSGYLIIRDFLPSSFIRNQNRHVNDQEVFCHKIIGSHAEIFKQIGNYQVLASRVFSDVQLSLTETHEYGASENRWIDILLHKTWE